MITRFVTESGSRYELDYDNQRIRRMSGSQEPTERQGKDGVWKHYERLTPERVQVGQSLIVAWAVEPAGLDAGLVMFAVRATALSVVVELERGDADETPNA